MLPGSQFFFLTVRFMGLRCVVPFSVQGKMGLLVGSDHRMFSLCLPSSAHLSARGLPRRPVLEGGSNYYCLLDLLSKVQWVLVQNSVLVLLSAVMHSHSSYCT